MVRRLPPRFSGISFGEWLKASRTNGTGGGGLERYLFLKYGTYTLANFASDGSGKLLVDEVFRMEDMDTVPAILAKRGLPIPPDAKVPRNNVGTGKTPLHVLYTPELVELVRRRYAEDIERFGYSFD
jgi:hypothetical protein